MTTQPSELEACSLTVSATMNTSMTVNGAAVTGETFDLNDPIVLTASYDGKNQRLYSYGSHLRYRRRLGRR